MSKRWRVGSKIPINVYEGDRPICQCHTALDARRIVDAVNYPRVEVETGILIALGVIYDFDQETLAEELVGACDERALLRIANKEQDPWLPNLKRTIRTLGKKGRKDSQEKEP